MAEADAKLTARQARSIAEKTKEVLVGRTDLLGRYMAEDLVNEETGEIFAEAGEELAEARLARWRKPASPGCPPWRSISPMAPGSATRWRLTRTPTATTR